MNDKPESQQKRTPYHIATFVNGFAAGWKIAVPEAFKDALDIKMTDRVANKRKFKAWTQGNEFSFQEGDTLYDTPLAYSDWNGIKDQIKTIIQVRNRPSKNEMSFTIIQPRFNNQKHQMECKQFEFVGMLQTGILQRQKHEPLNILEEINAN